jgi:hypothetical protein
LFQPAHPVGHRTRREVHVIGEITPGHSSVISEQADDSSVDLVNDLGFHGLMVARVAHSLSTSVREHAR